MRFDRVPQWAAWRKPPYIGLKIIANVHTERNPLSEEQKALSAILKLIGEHCVYLLNANPDPTIRWQFTSYITRYYDNAAIKRFNKQQRKVQSLEKRQRKEAENAATGESKPSPKTGAGRRIGAVPGVFKGVQFRSQLEIRFVTQLESKGIKWIYESERLGEGNYLVDFYLPDLKCWVEVKGKPEPRDEYLLKEVAAYLAHERQERLYVYSQGKCLAVSEDRFQELKQPEFWILLKQT